MCMIKNEVQQPIQIKTKWALFRAFSMIIIISSAIGLSIGVVIGPVMYSIAMWSFDRIFN